MNDNDLILKYYPDYTIIKTFLGNDGTVYILENNNKKDKIALKILHKTSWSNPSDIENEATNQLNAYSLGVAPKVFKYDTKEGFMASEYIDGITLDEYIIKHPKNVKKIKEKVKNILDLLYDNGIIHGDLAGSNFIIDLNGDIKIIDFSNSSIKKSPINRDYYITGELENFNNFGNRSKRRKSRSKRRKSRSKRRKSRSKRRKSRSKRINQSS